MVADHVPQSIVMGKIPAMAQAICSAAGMNYLEMDPQRYLLTTDQLQSVYRENKRSSLGHNVGDLAQLESLLVEAKDTHFIKYTPLIFEGAPGDPVEQNFQLIFMDKGDAEILKRRGSHACFLDGTFKVNDVSGALCDPCVTLV